MTMSFKVRGALAGVLSLGLVASGATALTAAGAAEPDASIYLWTGDKQVPTLAEKSGDYDKSDQLVISASDTDVNAEIQASDYLPEGQTAAKVYRFVAPEGQTERADWTAWEITSAAGPEGGVLNDNFTLEDHSRGNLASALAEGGDYWVGLAFTDASDNVLASAHRVLHIQPGNGKFTVDPAGEEIVTVNGATPTITAKKVAVGQTLTAKPGSWGPSGVKLSYQWLRNGSPIKGATKSAYKATTTDRGKKLSVRVTGSLSGAESVTRTSKSTVSVAYGALSTKTPKVSGTAKVKKKLKASAGTWGPKGVKLSYQWLRNGKPIKGATKTSYKLVKKDAGKKISVKVTGKLSGYSTASKVSTAKKIKK